MALTDHTFINTFSVFVHQSHHLYTLRSSYYRLNVVQAHLVLTALHYVIQKVPLIDIRILIITIEIQMVLTMI